MLRRVAVRVPLGEAESGRARLLALVPEGLEEREAGGSVELAVYVDAAAEASLRAAFDDVASEAVEPGWEDGWRRFHRPVRAGGLWIGPPWVRPPAGERAIVVDPGRAFGTGGHATTRLSLELLARVPGRASLLDVGCGSGVLAVAAVRLGFGPVHAVDVDASAVEVARATARANAARVEVVRADALHDDLPEADVVVANVELRVVETLLARLAGARRAITSGYLAGERPAAPGWRGVDRCERDGWAADAFERE